MKNGTKGGVCISMIIVPMPCVIGDHVTMDYSYATRSNRTMPYVLGDHGVSILDYS